MSADVEAAIAAPRAAAVRPRRGRWIALGVVAALVLGVVVSAITYRSTVTSERRSTFMSVIQVQSSAAYAEMQGMGWGKVPADAAAMSQRVDLVMPYPQQGRAITVSTPRMRLQESGLSFLVLNAEMSNGDLPSWVGSRYDFVSLLLFGTYTNDSNGVTSDEGSCVVRLGDPYAPVLTDTVDLGDGVLANPCTAEQLELLGIR